MPRNEEESTPAPTIEDLAAELAGEIDHAVLVDVLPDRDGGAMFTAKRDPVRVLALVGAVLTDSRKMTGHAVRRAAGTALDYSSSAGTVYSVLHSLHDDGLLARMDMGRNKPYTVGDPEAVDAALAHYERELEWYLVTIRLARDRLAAAGVDDSTETETE